MVNAYIPNGRSGPAALDLGVAALAAASAGFVAFAMPDDLFAGIVAASRLPDVVVAAQPPLGESARFAAVGVATLVTFLLVFLLMRALDPVPAKRPPVVLAEPEAEPETPRARRADAHPDAPTRRPLLAGRELGEPEEQPLELKSPLVEEPEHLKPAPLPRFLAAEQPAEEAPQATQAEPEPQPQPQVEAPKAAEEPKEESAAQLMQRLERGLGRRQKTQALSHPEPEPQAQPDDQVGHRLRSAISELQQMASRGG